MTPLARAMLGVDEGGDLAGGRESKPAREGVAALVVGATKLQFEPMQFVPRCLKILDQHVSLFEKHGVMRGTSVSLFPQPNLQNETPPVNDFQRARLSGSACLPCRGKANPRLRAADALDRLLQLRGTAPRRQSFPEGWAVASRCEIRKKLSQRFQCQDQSPVQDDLAIQRAKNVRHGGAPWLQARNGSESSEYQHIPSC